MGFDLYGRNAKVDKSEYFRNNVWWWHPLWDYVCDVCEDILTEEDMHAGHFNEGHEIDEDKARRIAQRLFELIEEGKVQKYSVDYKERLNRLPDEGCEICSGTGKRNDEFVKGQCNACKGKGEVRPFQTNYPFDIENVRKFAEFCRDSGGFEIC